MWDSLHLFSPAQYSSPPGRLMPTQPGETYADAGHVVDCLTDYERYSPPVHHGTRMDAVRRNGDRLLLETDSGTWRARAVISTTGTWSRRFLPVVPGHRTFTGRQLHTANYRCPADFAGQRVIVIGAGNSGVQIAADLALDGHVEVTRATRRPLRFVADDIDGRALFDVATARGRAFDAGRTDSGGVASLGDIVAVPPLRTARDIGLLHAKPMFSRLMATRVQRDDSIQARADAIIWCTGFRPALTQLTHLTPLSLRGPRGHIAPGTRALDEPRLHLLGYGDGTGPASARLIGVGPPALATPSGGSAR